MKSQWIDRIGLEPCLPIKYITIDNSAYTPKVKDCVLLRFESHLICTEEPRKHEIHIAGMLVRTVFHIRIRTFGQAHRIAYRTALASHFAFASHFWHFFRIFALFAPLFHS